MYEQHDLTKGRIMLVQEDVAPYLMDHDSSPGASDLTIMPPRLKNEHIAFVNGSERGPLMMQELEFQRRLARNLAMKHPLNMSMLQDIQRQNSGPPGSVKVCYCMGEEIPFARGAKDEINLKHVKCSYRHCKFGGIFHKRCVIYLGFEKMTRWYCTDCQHKMKKEAYKALNISKQDGEWPNEGALMAAAENMVTEMLAQPGMNRIMSRLQNTWATELRQLGAENDD